MILLLGFRLPLATRPRGVRSLSVGTSHRVVGVSGGEARHTRAHAARGPPPILSSSILDDRGLITGYLSDGSRPAYHQEALARLDGTS